MRRNALEDREVHGVGDPLDVEHRVERVPERTEAVDGQLAGPVDASTASRSLDTRPGALRQAGGQTHDGKVATGSIE